MLETNRIYNSDCIEGMKQIECGGGGLDSFRSAILHRL